jgi:hypothetical protein
MYYIALYITTAAGPEPVPGAGLDAALSPGIVYTLDPSVSIKDVPFGHIADQDTPHCCA